MIHQLRIYEIFEGSKGAFHARFRDHAARISYRSRHCEDPRTAPA